MSDAHPSGSPLDTVAETVGEQVTGAFELLANQTRLAILLALWEAQDPGPSFIGETDDALSFSELYDRVDIRDSGNFTYHLDKLVGLFVQKTDEKYALATPAERILSAVFAGALTDPPSFEGKPIDADCYRCGSAVVVDYSDTRYVRRCTGCEGIWENPDWPSGTLVGAYRPPAAMVNRSVEAWNRECNIRDYHRRASMMEGVCPDCSGTVTTTINICDDHDTSDDTVCKQCGSLWEVQTLFVCDVCKFAWITPAWAPIFTETAVLAFFHDHGLDPRSFFEISFYSAANREIFDSIERTEVTSEPPVQLTVTVELDNDRLKVTLDDEARVADVVEESSDK